MLGEMALVGKSARYRNIGDRLLPILKEASRFFDPSLDNEAMRRHTGSFFEGMGKMVRIETGDVGQFPEAQFVG